MKRLNRFINAVAILTVFGLLISSSPAVAALYAFDFRVDEAIIGEVSPQNLLKPAAVSNAKVGKSLNAYCSFNIGDRTMTGTYVLMELIIDGQTVKKQSFQVKAGGYGLGVPHTFNTAGTHTLTCKVTPQKGAEDTNKGNNSKTVSVNVVNTTTFKVTTSVSDPAGGSISPASASVPSGGTQKFTVTANAGYSSYATGCQGNIYHNGTANMTTPTTADYKTGPITADCTVTANFYRVFNLSVAKTGSGSGTVVGLFLIGNVIDCGTRCSYLTQTGTSITLTATPASGSTFEGWSGGGCSGTGTCTVTVNADTTVTAKFNAN